MSYQINQSRVDEAVRQLVNIINVKRKDITDKINRSVAKAYDELRKQAPKLATSIMEVSIHEVGKLGNKIIKSADYIINRLRQPTEDLLHAANQIVVPAVRESGEALISALIAMVISKITDKNHSITKDDIIPTDSYSQGGYKGMNDTQKKQTPEQTGKPVKGKNKAKDSRQYHNNPNWYTNLDTHTEFKVPLGYPDIISPFKEPGTKAKAVINVIKQIYVPTAGAERIARTQQIFDMMKAVRGLSGNLPYSVTDLMQYLDVTYWAVNEYYRLLAALRITEYYSLQKSPLLPNSILDNIGFRDAISHKAQYIELLCSMHNFIRNSMPTLGTILKKIKGQWDSIIPDSNDTQFAVWYMYITDHVACMPSATDPDNFAETMLDPALGISLDEGTGWSSSKDFSFTTYSDAVDHWNLFMSEFGLNPKFGAIRGDLLGAFGPSVVLNLDLDYKRSMFGKYDELALMKIHNTEFAFNRMLVYSPSTGNFREPTNYILLGAINYTTNVGLLSVNTTYSGTAFESGDKVASTKLPGCEPFEPTLITELSGLSLHQSACVIDTHKINISEGEALELLDGKIAFYSIAKGSAENALITKIDTYSDYVPLLMVCDYYSINIDDQGLQDSSVATLPVINGVYHTFNVIAANEFSKLRTVTELISQSDWAPMMRIAYHYSNDGVTQDHIKWDMNISGSIDINALKVAIRYIRYSIFAGDVSIGSKRFDNLVAVFNSNSRSN